MNRIYEQIAAERKRQHDKWGEQNWPMWGNLNSWECKRIAKLTKKANNKKIRNGRADWFDILREEMLEAFAETDPVKQREEMIQVASVAVAIVEYLDRQIEGVK